MKRFLPGLLAVVMLLTCAGCKKTPDQTIDPKAPDVNMNAPENLATPTPEVPDYTNPLTGEPMHEDISMNRPVAVMVNNIIKAQPQRGVSNADMIFEIPAEGGVTRMLAIFQDVSGIASIGSVRSLRSYYLQVTQGFDAILVHAGGSEEAYTDLKTTGWDHIDGVMGNYHVDPFYRDKDRMANGTEHSLFAVGDKIIESIEDSGYETTHKAGFDYGYSFSEDAGTQCKTKADYAKIIFNSGKNTSFVYDSKTGLYTGYQFGERYKDDGKTDMTFKNLLLLSAGMNVYDGVGRLSVDFDKGGTGYFICEGKSVEINWVKTDDDTGFEFTLKNGMPLDLGIGKTYIGIHDKTAGSVTFEKSK